MPRFVYPTPDPTNSPSSRDESKTRKRDDCYSTDDSDQESLPPLTKRQKVSVQGGDLCFPASHYGCQTQLSVVPEREAINDLAVIWNGRDHSQEDYNIWTLDDFSVYRNATDYKHPKELCPLHHLKTEWGVNDLLFDGVLSIDDEQRVVQGVPFSCLNIEGYGDESNVVTAYIQTTLGNKANVWYQLASPSKYYARYHDAFLWVSRFVKYVVDFIENSEEPVTFSLFRRSFYPYLMQRYSSSSTTETWLHQHQSSDFGQAFSANIGYVIKECYGVDNQLLDHPIFGETDPFKLLAIPEEANVFKKTVITPFVFSLFKKMPFHTQMQVLHHVDPVTLQKRRSRRIELGLTPLDCRPTPVPQILHNTRAIRKGDVVSVSADTQTQWRGSTGSVWYVYVQDIRTLKTGAQKLDVLWLYEPPDTTLGHGSYPWKNELFLSDNCACGKDSLDAELVQSIIPVQWYVTNPEEFESSFFVRQKFRTEPTLGAYDFVQLQPEDFRCGCKSTETEMEKVRKEFRMGDTVLTYHLTAKGEILEPAIVRGFSHSKITLQPLLRSCRDLNDSHAPPNQVVPGDDIYEIYPDFIIRRCKVATFATIDNVRSPYDRNGAGDLWFVISQSAPDWNFDNHEITADRRLRGMGIFCGAGSLDRGLADGGTLAFKWGVDWAERALHTYRANADDPEETKFFLGSVNDYLAKAIQGSNDDRIAAVGDVDLLAAGSPCPGFSVLQQNKNSDDSLRNCSLVASVCAYVDHYMPLHLVLENVIGIARNPNNAKELNVFSQVLCSLVSMGYQVKQVLMDPAHYGSCQSRQRVFIIATAPNHVPPDIPPHTHTCKELERSVAIGRASNGVPFGKRKNDVCPFKSLTAKEAFQDLPDIGNSHVQTCIAKPDHRTCRLEDSEKRALMQMLPRWPYGQSFMQAVAAGKMSKQVMSKYCWQNKSASDPKSKSWSRLYPDRLAGCLTTECKPHDAFTGRALHYDQHRPMTVMEGRRVQSIPDYEVVIGSGRQQWMQIGNGVDRKVSFAIGMQLAHAFYKTWAAQSVVSVATLPTVKKAECEERSVQTATVIREEIVVRRLPQSTPTEASASISVFERNMFSSLVLNDFPAAMTVSPDNGADFTSMSNDALFVQPVIRDAPKGMNNGVLRDDGIELIVID